MTRPKRNTIQKSPFLRLDPVFIFDVVGVCQERIERQEGEGVDVRPGGEGVTEFGTGDLGGDDGEGDPVGMVWC